MRGGALRLLGAIFRFKYQAEDPANFVGLDQVKVSLEREVKVSLVCMWIRVTSGRWWMLTRMMFSGRLRCSRKRCISPCISLYISLHLPVS